MAKSSRRVGWSRPWGRLIGSLALTGAIAGFASQARAQVFQTDTARTALPQPVGTDELNLGAAWGYVSTTESYFDPTTGELLDTPIIYGQYYSPPQFPQFVDGDAFTLSGLFKWRGEQIDPVMDATTEPGHFFPGCGLRVELVLHGGGCDLTLGWYNFTGNNPPALADIQPLVPKGSTYLNNTQLPLVPLAWDNRDPRNLSKLVWTPKVFSPGDITTNPKYTGGDVAFVMLGDAATSCKADKFSVYEHNAKNITGVPWVTALIYRSRVDSSAIYLAFEDLPMSPDDWRNGAGNYRNDGDFNDAVFYISGLGSSASCPDPACRDVVCGAGNVCADGVCVPASIGSGGAGEGGASSNGGADATPSSDAGAAPTSQGGAGTDTTSEESAGAAPEGMGGAATASGGTPDSGPGTGPHTVAAGCSCRVGSRQPPPARSLCLALAVWLTLSRRRRRARGPKAM